MNTINPLSTMVTANPSVSAEASAFSSVSSPIPTTLMDSNDHNNPSATQATTTKDTTATNSSTATSKSLATVTPSPTNFVFDAAASVAPTATTPVSAMTTNTTSHNNTTDPPKDDDNQGEEEEGRINKASSASGTEPSPTDRSNSVSSTTSLACLAKLCSSILAESKKRDVFKQDHVEEEYGNDDDAMPTISDTVTANTTIRRIISPSTGATVAHPTIDTLSLLIPTTNEYDDDDEDEQKQPAFAYEDSLISSAAASSPMATRNATPKTRPTSLYTDDHPSEMNKLHCYLLKDILELYYVDTSSKIAKKKAVFKPNPNAYRVTTKSATSNADGDMTTAVTTTHKRRRTKTAKAMALEEYDDEDEAAEENVFWKKSGDDVSYEEEDATANDDDDATSPLPAKRRKTLTSAKDEPIADPYVEIGRRKQDIIPLSEATNVCAVRCKFCRKEKGTGVIWVKSLSEQHLYVKVAAFYRLHLKDCKHCPPSVLAKFKSLKAAQSKRGRKDFWIKSALKQGLVTVVDDMGRNVGIAFKE